MARNRKPKHIAIAGNIGAGKTTLTEMLSKHYKWIPQFEDVEQNPYLNDFYEDANIFAPNLHEMGLMSKRDFTNYFQFFETLKKMVQPPDLLIYLKASVPTLVAQIQKRGREYEENIRLKIYDGPKTVIQEKPIYKDPQIFAPNLHEMVLSC